MLEFRVWDNEINKFINTDENNMVALGSGELGEVLYYNSIFYCNLTPSLQTRYIPMQSTGMIDLNYNTIYEGDIVRKKCLTFGDETTTYVWDVTAWLRTMPSSGLLYSLEILGNAYEHPELLPDWKDVKYDDI